MLLISTTITNSNETIIQEALKSVIDIVDLCLIIDTGIKDQTIEKAEEIAQNKLRISTLEWKNDFSGARNFALAEATKLGGDWALTLDTDERVITTGFAVREYLEQVESFIPGVLVRAIDNSYPKERFIRLPAMGQWEGRTHEHFSTREGSSKWPEAPVVRFRELPKSKEALEAKFRRDEIILAEEVSKHPENGRQWYYYGETLKNLGRHAEALLAYMKCRKHTRWAEEAAWSCYRAAECCISLNKLEDALDMCSLGLSKRADVPELAWLAGWISHKQGNYYQAIRWSKIAAHMAGEEKIGIKRISFSFPLGQMDGPYDILKHSYTMLGDAEKSEEAETIRKIQHAKRLGYSLEPKAIELFPSFTARRIDIARQEGYHCMNPSIAASPLGLAVNVRTVNYRIEPNGSYVVKDADGIYRTENHIAFLDQNLNIVRSAHLQDATGGARSKFPVEGYEDLRLFWWKKAWWGSATVRNRTDEGTCQIGILEIENGRENAYQITNLTLQKRLTGADGKWIHEKNWAPLVRDDDLYFVYSTEPLVIRHVDQNTMEVAPIESASVDNSRMRERGSSQFIHLPSGEWLAVTHQAIFSSGPRRYTHRFVRLSSDLSSVTGRSAPFVFLNHSVEFCAGLCLYQDDKIALSFGVRDREAWLATIEIKELANQLRSVQTE